MATTPVTFTISGAAGTTFALFTKLPSAVAVEEATRVGPGDIVAPALTIGRIYEAWSQGKTLSGLFGIGSGSVFTFIQDPAGDIAAEPLAGLIDRMRAIYAASPNVLAWIQSVNGAETSDRHVFLGSHPTDLRSELTFGPLFLVSGGIFSADNAGQDTTHDARIPVVVRHFWFEKSSEQSLHITELDFLWKIMREVLRKNPYDPVFGSSVLSASGPVVEPFGDSYRVYLAEITYELDMGVEEVP